MSENIFKFPNKENENELDNSQVPSPPESLGYEAKCAWIQAAEDLFKKGYLDGGSLDVFYSYCVLIGEARECEAVLAVDGKIVGGKKHPAYGMMLEAIQGSRLLWESLTKVKKVEEKIGEEENNWKKDKGLLA